MLRTSETDKVGSGKTSPLRLGWSWHKDRKTDMKKGSAILAAIYISEHKPVILSDPRLLVSPAKISFRPRKFVSEPRDTALGII